MIFSPHIENAIELSIKAHELHQKQKRKGKDVPYIVHPLIVGMLLARVGAPEEVIAAGILHDTIEDSPKERPVTREHIERSFSPKIASIVAAVTEDQTIANWEERKKESIERIKKFTLPMVLVRSADVLANSTEMLNDYKRIGMQIFIHFGARAPRILEHFMHVMSALEERSVQLPKNQKNPFIGELHAVRARLKRLHAQVTKYQTE